MPEEVIMPFGKYKGHPMHTIPTGYLVYIYDNMEWLKGTPKKYIEANLEQLRAEANKYMDRKKPNQ